MLTVAHIVPTLGLGGVGTHIRLLESHSRRRFKHVAIGLFSADQVGRFMTGDQKPDCMSAADLASALMGMKADIVHTHHLAIDHIGISAARLAGIQARVRTVHGVTQSVYSRAGKQMLLRQDWTSREMNSAKALSEAFGTTVCVSGFVRSALLAHGFSASGLQVIYNGVPIARNGGLCSMPLERGLPYDVPSGRFLIGFLGRLEPVKRAVDLAPILKHLVSKIPSHLLVVGSGPDEKEVREAFDRQGLSRHVTFAPATREVTRFYNAIDALILPSFTEGCPYVALEAMAHGIPVVASNVGGLPEVVDHGISGYLYDLGDSEMAAEALVQLHDRRLRGFIGAAGTRRARMMFSMDSHIESMHRVYQESLSLAQLCE